MSFNAPADFTKKMLLLLLVMTCRMMLNCRANLAPSKVTRSNVNRSFVVDRYYMRLVLPVMAFLVFMAPAGAQSLSEPLSAADVIPVSYTHLTLPTNREV